MMLGSSTREVCLSKITVESIDGKERLEVEVTRVERRKLFMVDNPHYPDIIKSFKHLEGVTIVDNDPKPFLPVHLILGASDYAAIKMAEPARVGELGEPVAEKTKFGWTLMSPGKELDHSKMLLTQTSYTDNCVDWTYLAWKIKLNMIKKQCMLSFVNNLYVIQTAGMKQGCCGRSPTHHCRATSKGAYADSTVYTTD